MGLIKNGSSIPSFVIDSVKTNQAPIANKKRAIVVGVNFCKAKSFGDISLLVLIVTTDIINITKHIMIDIPTNIYPRKPYEGNPQSIYLPSGYYTFATVTCLVENNIAKFAMI